MELRARLLKFDDLDDTVSGQWRELESLAIEPNLYCAPDFAIPAVRWLTPDRPPFVMVVDSVQPGHRPTLLGLALITACRGSTFLPVPHLRLYRTSHTFTAGLLLERGAADLVLAEMVRFLRAHATRWHALELVNIPSERTLFGLLRHGFGAHRLDWHEVYRFERPIIDLRASPDPLREARKSVLKDARRRERRLAELGVLEKRLRQGGEATPDSIENHLRLESTGWKARENTAMGSSGGGIGFFRDMASRFCRHGRALFSEVALDGNIIASSSNFQSGRELFAFKIGWDPRYARWSPGTLSELCLMQHLASMAPHVDWVDSGTEADSYLAQLWPRSTWMTRGFFAISPMGHAALKSMAPIWRARQRVGKVVRHLRKSHRSARNGESGDRR